MQEVKAAEAAVEEARAKAKSAVLRKREKIKQAKRGRQEAKAAGWKAWKAKAKAATKATCEGQTAADENPTIQRPFNLIRRWTPADKAQCYIRRLSQERLTSSSPTSLSE